MSNVTILGLFMGEKNATEAIAPSEQSLFVSPDAGCGGQMFELLLNCDCAVLCASKCSKESVKKWLAQTQKLCFMSIQSIKHTQVKSTIIEYIVVSGSQFIP